MNLNVKDIKERLLAGEEILVDESILALDMKSMYDYYQDEEVKPPHIDKYFDTQSKFETKEFSKAYFTNLTGQPVDWNYTTDGWMVLKIVI